MLRAALLLDVDVELMPNSGKPGTAGNESTLAYRPQGQFLAPCSLQTPMSATHYNAFAASSPSASEPASYLRRPQSTPAATDDDDPFLNSGWNAQTRPTTRPTIGVASRSSNAKRQGERQPLLAVEEHEPPNSPHEEPPDFGEEVDKDSWKIWAEELKVVLKYTFPVFGFVKSSVRSRR